MSNSIGTTIQGATSLAKASKVITLVANAVKDVASNLPEFTPNQTTVIKSATSAICVGGFYLSVRAISKAKYALKISKGDGITLAPGDIKTV